MAHTGRRWEGGGQAWMPAPAGYPPPVHMGGYPPPPQYPQAQPPMHPQAMVSIINQINVC